MKSVASRRYEDSDVLKPLAQALPPAAARLLARSPRLEQGLRDVAMLAELVKTERRPVAKVYGESSNAEGPSPMKGERQVEITQVEHHPHGVSIYLRRPAGLSFEAGQFLTLILPISGRLLRRSYSFSSGPHGDADWRITIKRVEGGLVSNWLADNAKPGLKLRVRGPSGGFVVGERLPADLLLIAGGSGITPFLSMLAAFRAEARMPKTTLICAQRGPEHFFFREEIALTQKQFPKLFRVIDVLEEGARGPDERSGRIDEEILKEALERHGSGDLDAMLCGPEGLIDAMRTPLVSLGVPSNRIAVEQFQSPRPQGRPQSKTRRHLRISGQEVVVEGGETLLEAMTRAELPVPFSCTMGGCGACKLRLVSGEVSMDKPNCLTADEETNGLVLTCVCHPLTDVELAPLTTDTNQETSQ